MIDTIRFGNMINWRLSEQYQPFNIGIRNIILNCNKLKYRIMPVKTNNVKQVNKYVPLYVLQYRISNKSNPYQYVYLKFLRVGGYSNCNDLIFKSELSRFQNIDSFVGFILGLAPENSSWKNLIFDSIPLELHVKSDTDRVFNFYRRNCSYPHSFDPKILENPKTGRRTLYLTKNLYIYEKPKTTRLERKFKSRKDIFKNTGITCFADLANKDQASKFVNPFSKLQFNSPKVLTKSLTDKNTEIHKAFLRASNSRKQGSVRTRNGCARVKYNCFASAQVATNKLFSSNFSKQVKPYLKKVDFDLEPYFRAEIKEFYSL